LDRIKLLHLTKATFEIPEDFSLDKFLKPSFGVFQGEPTRVRIWFSPEVAGYIREKIWHESQKIENQEDGSLILEATVAGIREIKYWVLGWGSHAVVLEPGELREEIRDEALRMLGRLEGRVIKEEIFRKAEMVSPIEV
jgi:predicted DNA-binding transcriptional regulator YafY